MKTTEEKNRMIAEFMGIEEEKTEKGEFVFAISFQNPEKLSDLQTEFYYASELKYHTSWEWLMPVVVHINSTTDYTVVIQAMDCYVYNVNNGNKVTDPPMIYQPYELIESVYDTVIQFIEWYNENK